MKSADVAHRDSAFALIGIGDNTVDDYTHLHTAFPGGNALNVAVYARELGFPSAYLGVFGSDSEAEHMQRALAGKGVDISRCHYARGLSGRASLTIRDGERVFTGSNEGGVRKSVSMEFIFKDTAYLKSFSVAHTSAYSFIDEYLERLHAVVPLISYDFSDDFEPAAALSRCRYVDIAFFSCSEHSEEAVLELLREATRQGCILAIATRGPRDAILFDGKSWYRQAPRRVTPVDTLGAGDAFIGAFLVSYAGQQELAGVAPGRCIESALEQAAAYAADICMVRGAFGQGLRY